MAEPETFWSAFWLSLKRILSWIGRKLLAPGVALLVVVAAIALLAMGFDVKVGGLLATLLGRKDPQRKAVDVANAVPPGRVDTNGNLIPVGTPDSTGQVQVQVVPVKEPGLFDDPTIVEITPPGEPSPIKVKLPDGVSSGDVEHVILAEPDIVAVTVKDSSGISAETVDSLLDKYTR